MLIALYETRGIVTTNKSDCHFFACRSVQYLFHHRFVPAPVAFVPEFSAFIPKSLPSTITRLKVNAEARKARAQKHTGEWLTQLSLIRMRLAP
jgi:hypothetical protein